MICIIFLFLYSFNIITSEICNFSFSCDLNDNNDYCAIKKRTDSNNIFELKVKKCPTTPCNMYDILLGEMEKTISCQELNITNSYILPSYSGGVCKSNDDCLSGICNGTICIDSQLGEQCIDHENCPLNTACINGTCSQYLELGEECNDTYQCEFGLFCNITKCDQLFQNEDGRDITDYISKIKIKENICKNNKYIIKNDTNDNIFHYYCESYKNIDYSCNDKCRYINHNGTEITFGRNCLCGYNKYRSKYCVLGNGEDIYQDFLKAKKEFMKNKELTQFCHTLERDNDDICLELMNTNKTVAFRNYVKEYNNKKILALEHHRLKESESCIKEVLFNYDTSPTFSINQQCPKFSCDSQTKNCFIGNNPLLEGGKNITIILNPSSCSDKEFCSLPKENKLINWIYIMYNVSLIGQCKIFQGKYGAKRYPGEECNINSDCVVSNSTCINGKCTGIDEGKICNETEQCLVGLYCNKNNKKCEKQKAEGESCSEGWDCQNFLGCFRGRCIKLGTLKKGIKITNESAPFPGNDIRNYLCYTGELNGEDGLTGNYCVYNNYDSNWLKDKHKDIDENGFVKCNFGEECVYHNGRTKYIKYCECGYNSIGQGYCPYPSEKNLEAWGEKIQYIVNYTYNAECHSLSRLDCYKNNNYDYFIKLRDYESKSNEAHLFRGSVDCAYKMYVKQTYLKLNLYAIIIFLISLIN